MDHLHCPKLKYAQLFGKQSVVKPCYRFMDDKNASIQSDGSGCCFSCKFRCFKQRYSSSDTSYVIEQPSEQYNNPRIR